MRLQVVPVDLKLVCTSVQHAAWDCRGLSNDAQFEVLATVKAVILCVTASVVKQTTMFENFTGWVLQPFAQLMKSYGESQMPRK